MDSQRPIERELRQAGQDLLRRAEPLGGLHPADRKALQDEVRRCYPTGSPQRQPASWPRLAWAFGLLLALGIAAWLVIPKTQPTRELAASREAPPPPMGPSPAMNAEPADSALLSKEVPFSFSNSASSPESPAAAATLGVEVAAAPKREALDRRQAPLETKRRLEQTTTGEERFGLADRAARSAADKTVAGGAATFESPALRSANAQNADSAGLAASEQIVLGGVGGGQIQNQFPASGSASNQSYAFLDQNSTSANNAIASRQWFGNFVNARTTTSAALTRDDSKDATGKAFRREVPAASPRPQLGYTVLSNFTVETLGRNVLVVDADGSRYEGTQTGPVALAEEARIQTRPQEADGTLEFSVQGTNKTANAAVRFWGKLVQAPGNNNTISNQAAGFSNANAGRQVVGNVSIGDGPHMPLEAGQLRE